MHRLSTRIVFLSIAITAPIMIAPRAIAAPPPAKASATVKVQVDWYTNLQSAEKLLANGNLAQGTNLYVAALKQAEQTKVSCNDPRFVELMAVSSEIFARCNVTNSRVKSPTDRAAANALAESALKWKEHSAGVLCGIDSPPMIAAYMDLAAFYSGTGQTALSQQYRDKTLTIDAIKKVSEVNKFRLAGKARFDMVTSAAFANIEKELEGLKQQAASH